MRQKIKKIGNGWILPLNKDYIERLEINPKIEQVEFRIFNNVFKNKLEK